MFYVLIGHRGAGKSAFLRRLAGYYLAAGRSAVTLDLDAYLGEAHGVTTSELFITQGEAAFRVMEADAFAEIWARYRSLAASSDVYVALGAGFSFQLPSEVQAVWVRRRTDALGRIFINGERPRLDPELSPLEEFRRRFALREPRYAALAHDIWEVPEGALTENPVERDFVLSALATPCTPPQRPVGGVLTLFSGDEKKSPQWLARRLAWKETRFELRDDLLDEAEIEKALLQLPPERVLYSFRRALPHQAELERVRARFALWDHALELGLPDASPPVLSLHDLRDGESIANAAERLSQVGEKCGARLLKFSPVVENFAELYDGHTFASAGPTRRLFLPRSLLCPGRWNFYRLLAACMQPWTFFREGDGSSADQPSLADYLRVRFSAGPLPIAPARLRFAALLGDPVLHSLTPIEQGAFFAARGLPLVAVAMSEAEWEAGALEVLFRIGLRYAAVTSPLKRHAAALCGQPGGAINTLLYREDRGCFVGKNTDVEGARALLAPFCAEPAVAIFGGGGTLEVVRAILPQARLFSARSGLPRVAAKEAGESPRVLIWASGLSRDFVWPDARFTPAIVVDLNYSEDSPGREYALRVGAQYVSGAAWFSAQAAAQRHFWADESAEIYSPPI